MSKKIILACLALVAFAVFVLPATASASPRLCETTKLEGGGEGEPCTNVGLVNVKGTNVGNWVLETSTLGNVVCTGVTMTGNVTKNSGTNVEGDITSATFSGGGTGGDCTGSLGTSIQVITNIGNGVPWCLFANSEMAADRFEVRGNACNAAKRSITFKFNITGLVDCWYNREANVVGTFTTDTATGEDAVLSFEKQQWNLEKEESTSIFAPKCPETGSLTGKATLETDSATTEPLYIK
jgi:hypothetical protein